MSSVEPLKGDAVCPCMWFGGQGEGDWRHEREGVAKVDLGLLERRREREYNSRAWSWVAGISNVLSGLSYSKLKVILVTCNSGFLLLKRL